MYRKYSGNDRRRYQRLDLSIIVLYRIDEPVEVRMQLGDKEIEATMLNLSEGGIGLLTNYNIPLWSVLSIKFTLSRMNKHGEVFFQGPMEITGEVRSNVMLKEGEHRLGICFTGVDQKDKVEIVKFIKEV